jgi:hypothetical protein
MYIALTADDSLFADHELRLLRLDDTCMRYLNAPSSATKMCWLELIKFKESTLAGEANIVLVTATWQQHTVTAIREVIQFFDNPGTKLLVFGSANFNDVASLSYKIVQRDIPLQAWGKFFAENKRQDWDAQNKRLQTILQQEHVPYIAKYDAYCSQQSDGEQCHILTEDGNALIYDTGHVTVEGATYLGRKFKDLGWLPQ